MYTNKSIRLHSKCLNYLDLIQQANNRAEDKRSSLYHYDNCKDNFAPIRLMNKREYIVAQKERWENLAKWLVNRYQDCFNDLKEETEKRLPKQLSTQTIQL